MIVVQRLAMSLKEAAGEAGNPLNGFTSPMLQCLFRIKVGHDPPTPFKPWVILIVSNKGQPPSYCHTRPIKSTVRDTRAEFHSFFSNNSGFSIIAPFSSCSGDICFHREESRRSFVSKLSTLRLTYNRCCVSLSVYFTLPLSVFAFPSSCEGI